MTGAVPPQPAGAPLRAGLGTFLRCVLDFLDQEGLRAQVLERVPPETAALFAAPPRSMSWVDARHIDAIEQVVFDLRGPGVCVEMGQSIARNIGNTLVQPVIRAAFFLFGEGPSAIFGNLDRFFSLTTRGLSFRWQPDGPAAGTVEATFVGTDVPEAALHVLQGTFQYVFELTGARGSVAPAVVRDRGPESTWVSYAIRLDA